MSKGFWGKMFGALAFWRREKREEIALADLWMPAEREALLEKERQARLERVRWMSCKGKEPLEPEPEPSKAELRRMRKQQRRLEKLGKKMTKLALRGKMPLEQVLPMAFPEIGEWHIEPSKTEGLKPFTYVDVPDASIDEMMGALRARLESQWNHRLENLCAALVGALLFMAAGGDEEDAMTILGFNCGPVREDAEEFVRGMRGQPLSTFANAIEEFARRMATDQRWLDSIAQHQALRERLDLGEEP